MKELIGTEKQIVWAQSIKDKMTQDIESAAKRWVRSVKYLLASQVQPLHEIRDIEKYEKLKKNMKFRGWNGLPLVVIDSADGYRAINGSHRLAAAANCGRQVFGEIEIPVIILDEEELNDHIEGTEYTFDDIFDQDHAKYILQGFNEEAAQIMEQED